MEKATRFKKARIIALDAGVFLGSVARLILDLETRQVAGLLIEGGQHAIDGEDVRALGEDAVTVTTAARIIDLGEAEELAAFIRNEDEVYRKEVFTVAGKKVGFITDVLIDPNSKAICGFEMFSEFLFQEEVHGVILLNEEVIFGRDLVLVPSDIERLIARSEDYVAPPAPAYVAPTPIPVPAPAAFPVAPIAHPGSDTTALTGDREVGTITPLPGTQPTPSVTPFAPAPVTDLPQGGEVSEVETPATLELTSDEPTVVDFSMPEESKPQVPAETEPTAQPEAFALEVVPAETELPGIATAEAMTQGEETYEGAEISEGADELTEDVAIDFSGVEVPTPEIIREAPEKPEEEQAGPDKPDMEKIFASFPLGVQEEQGQAESGFTFGESPQAEPEQEAPAVEVVEEPPPPPEPEKPASPKDKLIRFVLGKTSSRDIFDVDGNLILGKGQEITEDVVRKAQAAELMPQVFLAASQGLHSRLKRG